MFRGGLSWVGDWEMGLGACPPSPGCASPPDGHSALAGHVGRRRSLPSGRASADPLPLSPGPAPRGVASSTPRGPLFSPPPLESGHLGARRPSSRGCAQQTCPGHRGSSGPASLPGLPARTPACWGHAAPGSGTGTQPPSPQPRHPASNAHQNISPRKGLRGRGQAGWRWSPGLLGLCLALGSGGAPAPCWAAIRGC